MSFRPARSAGARLKPEVLAVTVGDRSISEFTRMSVTQALRRVPRRAKLTETELLIGARIIKEIRERLTFLDNVGVGHLQLDRAAATLSGGEAQRLRLATQIGSQLVGVLYILDEPSIGLHQQDNGRLIDTLERLRDLGNTVLVVEHDERMMRAADWLVDMGPGAGESTAGTSSRRTGERGRAAAGLGDGQFLSGGREIAIPERRADDRGVFAVLGARSTMKEIDVEFPVGKFVLRHRGLGLGQVDARERDRLQGAREQAPANAREAGKAPRRRGDRLLRQGDRHRPEADRPDAESEPGDLHGSLHAHSRALLADARVEGSRLQAGPVLLQRPRRRARRAKGRDDQGRDALPPGRLRAVRDLPREALQRETLEVRFQGEVDRGRS